MEIFTKLQIHSQRKKEFTEQKMEYVRPNLDNLKKFRRLRRRKPHFWTFQAILRTENFPAFGRKKSCNKQGGILNKNPPDFMFFIFFIFATFNFYLLINKSLLP